MLFASDLDQTLIYSQRTLTGQEGLEQAQPVEWLQDRNISFMTSKALRLLKEVSVKLLFVPVTTRTKAQYLRVNLAQYGVHHQYAVTSNGGIILKQGIEDLEWQQHIRAQRDECLATSDLVETFEKITHPAWKVEGSGKLADELFYYCLIERDKVPLAELAAFKLWANQNHWDMSIQGRKLYLVPKHINKKAAVRYIRDKEGLTQVIAAGDSVLDLEMLKAAQLGIAPAHGELFAHFCQGSMPVEGIKFTSMSGIQAAEEILEDVAQWLPRQAVV